MDPSYYTSCQICHKDFDETHHIPYHLEICHHSFCFDCIQTYWKTTNNNIIKCPKCMKPSHVRNLRIDNMAIAFTQAIKKLNPNVAMEKNLDKQLASILRDISNKEREIADIQNELSKSNSNQENAQPSTSTDIQNLEKENLELKRENIQLRQHMKNYEEDRVLTEDKIMKLNRLLRELENRPLKRRRSLGTPL